MADTVHVKGLDELMKVLDTLPEKLERNVMRGALRAGAVVLRDQARNNLVMTDTGQLAKGLKVSTNIKNGVIYAYVKAKGKHGHLANWVEFGVAAHGVKKGASRKRGTGQDGKLHPGFTKKPFMRPALDSQAAAATIAVGEYIKGRLLTKEGLDVGEIEISEV